MRDYRHRVELVDGGVRKPDGLILSESGWMLLRYEGEPERIERYPPEQVENAISWPEEADDDD